MEQLLIAMGVYIIGTLTMLLPRRAELVAHYVGMLCAIVASGIVAKTSFVYVVGTATSWLIDVKWGSYSLQADLWSSAFLLITGVAGVVISLYAIDYAKAYKGKRLCILSGLWNLFLLSIVAVLLAGDAFSFIVAWEIMALVSFLLVNHERDKKETVNAAYQYMVMTHIGTAAIMISFYLISSAAEGFSFASMSHNTLEGSMKHLAFACAFIGFALKSGIMPLHIWLPNAHPAAPSHVSALMSGVMLKVAIYGLGRVVFQFLGMECPWYGIIIMFAGLISAFLGVLYASMENDIKRSLAYSSVENMGIIFAAFGCGMLLVSMHKVPASIIAFTAVLVHAFSHSLMKGLLFMSAGSVMHATGSKNMEIMGGLMNKMPYTAIFTLVGAMALSSMPFTTGLVGEWMVLQSYITLGQLATSPEMKALVIVAFILLGLTGATALGCFVRLYGVTFLGKARSKVAENAHEQHFFMLLGMGINALLIVILGITPDKIVNIMQKVVCGTGFAIPMSSIYGISWNGSGSYSLYSPLLLLIIFGVVLVFTLLAITPRTLIRKEVTWNCGTYPTIRQQYSATGFSKPLRRAFDFILRPEKRKVFLAKANKYWGQKLSFQFSIPDIFRDKLYQPLQTDMIKIASAFRHIQYGSVRLYIGYTMVAMIVVLIWGVLL